MAVLSIPERNQRYTDAVEIRVCLAQAAVDYERLAVAELPAGSTADDVLAAHEAVLGDIRARGGYATADVIDVSPATAGLDEMLARFNKEHRHSEDEVRFIVAGRGLFHLHPDGWPVLALEVEPGDLIRVPAGMAHWFDLCGERRIRAIRLFQDKAGWTPHYVEGGVHERFQPLCFGPAAPTGLPQVRVRVSP